MDDSINFEKLQELRATFEDHQIGKLPKPTQKQTNEVKADDTKGIRCKVCGGWHHPKVIHLDYVGHAALTDRFLKVDPLWDWEPMATDEFGLPMLDRDGLLWIKLTICGVTRIGVGDAGNKTGGDAMKERIGDALRNAGMRFGAALDLWHKGDLHVDDDLTDKNDPTDEKTNPLKISESLLKKSNTLPQLIGTWQTLPHDHQVKLVQVKDEMKDKLTPENEAA